jgi:hypothetical protein
MDYKACFKFSVRLVGFFLAFLAVSDFAAAENEKTVGTSPKVLTTPKAATTPDEGMIRGPKTDKVPVSEIVFKDQLVIHDKGMSKDGGAMENVPCDAESGGVVFGFIQLDEKMTAELNCIDDYAGGIFITIKGAKGADITEKLGEVLGDAGESLETRSWITKKSGKINIQTVTYSSYQDPDAEDTAPVNCDKKAWSINFDGKSKKFKRKSITLNENEIKFSPAARVAAVCLASAAPSPTPTPVPPK